ncbi:MAG: hypothetical protein IIB15_00550 [Chloroflexi bacterium]|nr:hypothetical protein [Chloroflexota bacterium]
MDMMKFASLLIVIVALSLGGMIAISQDTASASSSTFTESVSEGHQEAVAFANPCTNDLNLSYADGTLTLGIELGATQPSTSRLANLSGRAPSMVYADFANRPACNLRRFCPISRYRHGSYHKLGDNG